MSLSWRGSEELKHSVLHQLAAFRQAAQLGRLKIDGTPIVLFEIDFVALKPDLAEVGRALAIPESVLAIGYGFFDRMPEHAADRRELVASYAEFFDAIPVGVELADIVPAYIEWLLMEMRALLHDAAVVALVDAAAVEIWDAEASPSLPTIERALAERGDERDANLTADIAARSALQPRRRKRFAVPHDGAHDHDLRKQMAALGALRWACTRPLPLDAASAVVEAVRAMTPDQPWRRERQLYEYLLDLLRARAV